MRPALAVGEAEVAVTEDRPKFAALQGWRGICALLVGALHFGQGIEWHFAHSSFVRNAYLFVDFFFVLSGFVIAYAYDDRLSSASDIRSFAVRRFGRLWPLHAVVVAAWVITVLAEILTRHLLGIFSIHTAFTDTRTPVGLLANLMLLHGFAAWPGAMWNPPSWSISVELWTCLVFALICLRPKGQRLFLAAALSLCGLLALFSSGQYMVAYAGYGFFRGLYGFFLGTLVYRAYLSTRWLRFKFPSVVEGLCVALTATYVGFLGHGPTAMVAPIVFAVIVYVFAFEAGIFSRALLSRPMARLGTWSYSIYLNHYLLAILTVTAIRIAQKFLGLPSLGQVPLILGNRYLMDVLAVVFFAALIGISAATYRFIEDPWRRRFNKLADRLQARPAAATEEAQPKRAY